MGGYEVLLHLHSEQSTYRRSVLNMACPGGIVLCDIPVSQQPRAFVHRSTTDSTQTIEKLHKSTILICTGVLA